MKIALILLALALPALAADSPSAKLIKDIEGSYEQRIDKPGKPGEKFEVDDRIDLLRLDDDSVYVHAGVTTPDGHRCTIYGVASYEKGALVYRDPSPPLSGDQCTLSISVAGDSLRVSDRLAPKGPSTCRALCTARGSLGDYSVPLARREKIANPAKLKGSREYAKAIKAFEEMQR